MKIAIFIVAIIFVFLNGLWIGLTISDNSRNQVVRDFQKIINNYKETNSMNEKTISDLLHTTELYKATVERLLNILERQATQEKEREARP